MSIDLRHLEPEALVEMAKSLEQTINEVCHRNSLEYTLTPTADFAPQYFDEDCVNAIRQGAEALKLPHMDIVSGAGHDAIFIGRVAPAAMIFVPCENGISHNEIENASQSDLHDGCNVLLQAVIQAAGVDQKQGER